MLTREIALAVGFSALAFGCAAQPSETQETIDNLVQAGFPADDIMVIDGVVYVGGDAVVSLEASREMLKVDPSVTQEQYRTTNIVSPNVTNICINGSELTGVLSTDLNQAIANYSALGLTFHMTRTSGGTLGCNAVITAHVTTGTGNSSGFPSGGLPFNAINISQETIKLPINLAGPLLMHELGHTIGLRHSDFFNRSISCGGAATNEGTAGVGATLIPGSPSGATVGGSIMNSCLSTSESGQFSQSDINSLRTLY